MSSLKLMLQATQAKNGIYLPPAQYDQMQALIASQTDRLRVRPSPSLPPPAT